MTVQQVLDFCIANCISIAEIYIALDVSIPTQPFVEFIIATPETMHTSVSYVLLEDG